MDNLTHSLVGLMIARTGLGRTTKQGGTLMLVLAANAPDVDALVGFPGSLNYIEYHRSYPHSIAFVPVMALAALLLARLIRKASITWKTYLACILAVLSHLLLDLTNVYGIRLYLPFSGRFLHLDTTDVIDMWIWLILLLCVFAPWLGGLVNSEIRSRNAPGPKRAWAWVALIGLFCYDGFRYAAHQKAIAVMSNYTYGGDSAPRIFAFPNGPNPLHWRGEIETSDRLLTVPVALNSDYNPGLAQIDYPAPDSPAVDAAKATKPFQVFLHFNQAPFWKVTALDDGTRVDLIDLRFSTPRNAGFASASALVGPNGRVKVSGLGLRR